jgi:hypothetical protein
MSMVIENPLGWVHFRLRGGLRTVVTASIGYIIIILGLILLSLRANPFGPGGVLFGWTQGLLGLQIGVLVVFGVSTIGKAVRKDVTTRMIESHRFMPVSAPQAIVGYVTGASVQAVVLAAINLLIGCFTTLGAGLQMSDWLFANGLLGIFALCLWFGSVFCSLLSPAASMLMIFLVVGATISQGALTMAVPALSVLCGPLIGKNVFGAITSGGTWNWALQVSSLAQLAAGGFCFLGAVRKYKREDVLAFGPRMSLLILIGWLGISTLGISHYDDFRSRIFPSFLSDMQTPVVGSLASALLIGILPVMSAVWMRRQWLARLARQDSALEGRAIPPEMVAISAAAFISLMGLGIRNPVWPFLAIATAGSSLAFLLGITWLLGIIYRASSRSAFIVALFICATWMLPIGIETGRYALEGNLKAPVLTWISTCSPIGAILAATTSGGPNPLTGIVVQFIPAVLLALLYYRRPRRRAQIASAA